MRANGHVYCLGPVVLDRLLEVDRLPRNDEKAFILARRELAGGPPHNAALAFAEWHEPVSLASVVGDDATGRLLLAAVDDEGIASDAIEVVPDLVTASSIVILDGTGERAILVEPIAEAVLASIGRELAPKPGDTVLVNFFHPEGAQRALARARDARALALLDLELPEIGRFGLPAAFATASDADIVATNAQVMRTLVPELGREPGLEAASRLARYLRPAGGRVCVTLGRDGVLARDGEALFHVAAEPLAATDTTGAGDRFLAGLANALRHGRPFPQALATGTAAAERFLLHDPCDWTEIEERARLIPVRMLEAEHT
jgi:sugar/nucleoside kinase (ribokinase family)